MTLEATVHTSAFTWNKRVSHRGTEHKVTCRTFKMLSPTAVLGADWERNERTRVGAGDQSGGNGTDSQRDDDGWDHSGQRQWAEVNRCWIHVMEPKWTCR